MTAGPRAGDGIHDHCAACKTARRHTVLAARVGEGPLRVVCDYCGSQHNFRGDPRREAAPLETGFSREPFALVSERERSHAPMSLPEASDLEILLRRVIREECGLTPVIPAEKWRGGEMVLRPGKAGLQEKIWPIESFFHKVVMLRNRLRVLEQQVNALDLPEDMKVKVQGYITGCYGTLTSFNVLFAEEGDRFQGTGGGSNE